MKWNIKPKTCSIPVSVYTSNPLGMHQPKHEPQPRDPTVTWQMHIKVRAFSCTPLPPPSLAPSDPSPTPYPLTCWWSLSLWPWHETSVLLTWPSCTCSCPGISLGQSPLPGFTLLKARGPTHKCYSKTLMLLLLDLRREERTSSQLI